jgi:hypothetical protein
MVLLEPSTAAVFLASRGMNPGAASEQVLGSCCDVSEREWDKMMDDKLLSWFGPHVDERDEDGLEWPSRASLASAYNLAKALRGSGAPAPSGVVPNGEGGVAFEWRQGKLFASLEVKKNAPPEIMVFEGSRLLHREALGPA